MSQSGESFTLLESGTSRLHFKLAKALEETGSTRQQDTIIIDTVAQIRTQLSSRSFSSDASKLASALLTLLHCLHHYPSSPASVEESPASIDISFALIPTLQLLSLATDWKHLLLAHQLLPFLLPRDTPNHSPSDTASAESKKVENQEHSEDLIETESQTSATASTSSRPPSSIVRGRSSRHPTESASNRSGISAAASRPLSGVDDSSSLLLLNTFRANLATAADQAREGLRPARSRPRSPSDTRSPARTKPTSALPRDKSSLRSHFRALESLRSLATGTPRGPAVLPSLASTLVALTRHPDCAIRSMTLNAMLTCASLPSSDQSDRDGHAEMLDAALTIVRLTLASTYAFSPGSDLEEQQGMILSEMDRRVDTNPTVLRSCIRVVEHARAAGLITDQEAACHSIEALQASRWAPMHLELFALQQERLASSVVVRTEGIRARTAARQRASLHADHDYHGSYAPWLAEACLSSLTASIESMVNSSSTQLDDASRKQILTTVLRFYSVASQGKAAALALCVAAARCIGALHHKTQSTNEELPETVGPTQRSHQDRETAALWSTLSEHIKSQLRSSNPNRKTAAVILLEALLPVGWAQNPAGGIKEQQEEKETHQIGTASPLEISEAEFGQLMQLLADPDVSIRKRVMLLLQKVDPSLAELLRTKVQVEDQELESNQRGTPASSLFATVSETSSNPVPQDSTSTLRSSKHNFQGKRSNPRGHSSYLVPNLHTSAIPSESKRLRDQSIAQAMSESIANLVLGSDAQPNSSESEVIFSATSSGVLEGEELEVIHEVADPERRLDIAAGQPPSLLDLVHQCHNHEPWLDTSLTPFVLDGVQIGFLPARVVKACIDDSANQRRVGAPAVLRKVRFAMNHREILPPTASSRICEAITFTSEFATPEARTTGLNAVAQRWREARIFPDPLDGWRDELYAIYGLNPRPGSRNPIAFKLERAACALFGFATFGVHLTAYTVAPATGELKVWVPQRSATKSTWPGYLDNSVAGGIVAGDLPMESMVRECEEEANLESTLVEKHIKQTGVLSYCYKTSKQGWIQPEVEYVYDLPLPADVTLQPKDGEVDHFDLMTLDEIYDKMREGKFKANCVLVMLDFLIRHGHITADREPGYRQIVAQLHVDLRLPGP
ncbi:uncharacterized protein UTRI_03220_B [Ustilago trichophora]|uniref:Nudix hydrolase domain-containing protein n=1 Tax=Ustilago trichophora TaxID=86804 RepID=A0A5C3E6Z6_9BASI|nr:uncharacterized protein UTRI_03220_B [Ustilago trichophora]